MSDCVTVRRLSARGDVLLATTLLPALRAHYGRVVFSTSEVCAPVLEGNPDIEKVVGPHASDGHLIDLTDSYEKQPGLHIAHAYAQAAGVALGALSKAYMAQDGAEGEVFDVVVHPTTSWENRTLPAEFWENLARRLQAMRLRVAFFGTSAEIRRLRLPGGVRVFMGLRFPQVAQLIAQAGVFVGADSLPLHIAATTETNIIGLFTIALPELREPIGRTSGRFVGMVAPVACIGCLHRVPAPVRFVTCERTADRFACVRSFNVDNVAELAKGLAE